MTNMSQVGQLMTGKMERTTVVLTEQMILRVLRTQNKNIISNQSEF